MTKPDVPQWPFPTKRLGSLGLNVPKKLTFDEWWHEHNDENTHYEMCRRVWNAAQENK
jgi:hypothetical protein